MEACVVEERARLARSQAERRRLSARLLVDKSFLFFFLNSEFIEFKRIY